MALQKFLEAILGVKIGSGSLITPSDSYFFQIKTHKPLNIKILSIVLIQ